VDNIKIKYIGHSTFLITTQSGKKIIIDPWLNDNPSSSEDVGTIGEINYILITHGHFDHVGDTLDIIKNNPNSTTIANFEIGQWLEKKGGVNISPMSHGGTQYFEDFKVSMVNAVHGSGISDANSENLVYGGIASGLILKFNDDFSIYHAGDTSIFGDMSLISDIYKPDLCMIPIGDHFTMGVEEAVYATKLIKARTYIPIHYGTFPVLIGDPDDFKERVESHGNSKVIIMNPGDEI
tara:strand:+ start:26 stop:736 length:711 start_codon:yes stop_codon:yes gene_type:complete